MSLTLRLVLGATAGAALGAAFFAALAWTVARLPHSRNPAALLAASLLGRLALALVALFAIVRDLGAAGVLAALGAFLLVRQAFLLQARR